MNRCVLGTILFFVFLLSHHHLIGQKAQLKKAEKYFYVGNYNQALTHFNQYKKTDKIPDLIIKRGICYLYTNQPDLCIRDMHQADIMNSIDNKRFYYSAKAYFLKGAYEESASFYKRYLNTLKRNELEYKQIVTEIKRCGQAINLRYLPQVGFTENMGNVLNSEYNEIKPKQSPNKPERYYFSSDKNDAVGGLRNEKGESDAVKGKFAYDIYYSEYHEGNWQLVMPISQLINTAKNEVIQGFNEAGSIMYYLKKEFDGRSHLLTDTFGTDKSILPKATKSLPFKADFGDQGLILVSDSLLIFSSKINQRNGDYDLVFSILTDNGWTEPLNFGLDINSSYNETAPFISKDGKTLYFSSDRLDGLGGYDIYFTNFRDGKWSKPQNFGPSINSPADDLDFEIGVDGSTAVFSSNRIQAIGGFDLFITYFKQTFLDQMTNAESLSFVEYCKRNHINKYTPDVNQFSQNSAEEEPENFVREIIVKPIYFTKDEDLLSPANKITINTFADILTVYPEVNIVLQSHCTPETSPEADLYFSIKRAEKIAEQLVSKGVNPDNIIIQSFGSNFPKAVNWMNQIQSTLAKRMNNRIDILWLVTPKTPLNIKYENAPVNEEFRDTRWDILENKNQKLTFRIQIASTSQMLKSEWMNEFKDFIIDKKYNESKYNYTLGNFLMYQEVLDLKNQLESQYMLTNLKIIPYLKGLELNLNEIQELKSVFPELDNYLQADK